LKTSKDDKLATAQANLERKKEQVKSTKEVKVSIPKPKPKFQTKTTQLLAPPKKKNK
jgi:hypothetical protein